LKRFIRYLYEYEQGKRLRNVGFVKVEQQDEDCTLNIHGKGLHMKGDRKLDLYLFFEENGECAGIWQGTVDNVNPAINYRLYFTEDDVIAPENFRKINGIILESDTGRKYAALWNDAVIDMSRMRVLRPGERNKGELPDGSPGERNKGELPDGSPGMLDEDGRRQEDVPVRDVTQREENRPGQEALQQEGSMPGREPMRGEEMRREESMPDRGAMPQEGSMPGREEMGREGGMPGRGAMSQERSMPGRGTTPQEGSMPGIEPMRGEEMRQERNMPDGESRRREEMQREESMQGRVGRTQEGSMPDKEQGLHEEYMPDREAMPQRDDMQDGESVQGASEARGLKREEAVSLGDGASDENAETFPHSDADLEMSQELTARPIENICGDVEEQKPAEHFQCTKIQRNDIARLPRCEWKWANNSFLLHGYYNYHHLAIIHDGEKYWLGVPGIYHPQEAKAASTFGFTEFIPYEDINMDLTDDEKSSQERFGYWCRPIKRMLKM